MNIKTFTLTAAAIALTIPMMVTPSKATTVTTKTHIQTQNVDGATEINFSAFDLNNDGRYSMREVGTKLFYLFDTDGNEVIDNLEWNNRNVMTITPMEKETFKFIDYNGDGMVDDSTYTYDQFFESSGLMRFDQNMDGLSAKDFIETGFQEIDDNDNNMIEIDEWKEVYMTPRTHKNAEAERYNK